VAGLPSVIMLAGDLKEKALKGCAHSWAFLFAPNSRQAWVCFN